ncbi:unnamed protein product [Musa hybrid cultivar]
MRCLRKGIECLIGLDEAVLKNIEACRQLSAITRKSLGPNGDISALKFSYEILMFFLFTLV